MLSIQQLRQIAGQTRRDIANVEIEVMLTYLLQLLEERGVSARLAFKGGTMLRKMVFGQSGRLSTDLDFTRNSGDTDQDIIGQLIGAFAEPYRGLRFELADGDLYTTEGACAANPVCYHDGNVNGVKIKVQISIRESPILPVETVQQKEQAFFRHLPFRPTAVPCLDFHEIVAEKIRAASQRAKIRDLYDLHEISKLPFNRELVRSLAVLKVWPCHGDELGYALFKGQIEGARHYDVEDLAHLLNKGHRLDLPAMIREVVARYEFLGHLTEAESLLAADRYCRLPQEFATFLGQVKRRFGPETAD